MAQSKIVSTWFDLEQLGRLDMIRGELPRSQAVKKILQYILSQDDSWVQALIGVQQTNTVQTLEQPSI